LAQLRREAPPIVAPKGDFGAVMRKSHSPAGALYGSRAYAAAQSNAALSLAAGAWRDVEVNWKIFLESFIEGHHIKSTHPESFLPYGVDNLNAIDLFGRISHFTLAVRKACRCP
jgi:hypothetical protein